MTKSSEDTVIAGTGTIYVAPVLTTAPTAEDDTPDADFYDLGYTTEDGVTFTLDRTTQDFGAWQSLDPIRRVVQSVVTGLAFTMEELNVGTVPFAFGGGDVTEPTSGHFVYDPPEPDEIQERAMIVDFSDIAGDRIYRFYFPKGTVTGQISMPISRQGLSVLPVTFSPVRLDQDTKTFRFFTNDDAFTPLGS